MSAEVVVLDYGSGNLRSVVRAMERAGAGPEECILVGDTKYDVEGAERCGIPCIGVSWGYAAPGELEKAGADRIVNNCEELEKALISSCI